MKKPAKKMHKKSAKKSPKKIATKASAKKSLPDKVFGAFKKVPFNKMQIAATIDKY